MAGRYRDGAGSNGASTAHCASVRSNRLVTAMVATRSPVGGSRLLVASYQGRGEYDLATGARVARDRDEGSSAWFDASGPSCLTVTSKEWVRVAGLAGGWLPRESGRWRIAISGEEVMVVAGDSPAQQLCEGEEVRVAGFAPGGDVLVIGRPMDVWIFRV
ncbi:hypothetical protein [Actinopolymorpha pittospori]|uniref:Uncharacterized protein n=1 Tax=Actinopolymorpha pittospori TaxID=648752 RepID=A0A927MS04_9ACTN|nr:hypothetical protein [Actinopolymorpha pittospori]MBE1605589.1 hypothetical protein [Actinopolymorpha pittospori]